MQDINAVTLVDKETEEKTLAANLTNILSTIQILNVGNNISSNVECIVINRLTMTVNEKADGACKFSVIFKKGVNSHVYGDYLIRPDSFNPFGTEKLYLSILNYNYVLPWTKNKSNLKLVDVVKTTKSDFKMYNDSNRNVKIYIEETVFEHHSRYKFNLNQGLIRV